MAASVFFISTCVLFLSDGDTPGCQEWAMIELQGDIETRDSGDLSGRFVGDLFFTKKGIPIVIIGHHILYGKVIKFDKPYAVLLKQRTEHVEDGEQMDVDEITGKSYTNYTVKAIVTKKLLFKTRPKPIIAHVPKKI